MSLYIKVRDKDGFKQIFPIALGAHNTVGQVSLTDEIAHKDETGIEKSTGAAANHIAATPESVFKVISKILKLEIHDSKNNIVGNIVGEITSLEDPVITINSYNNGISGLVPEFDNSTDTTTNKVLGSAGWTPVAKSVCNELPDDTGNIQINHTHVHAIGETNGIAKNKLTIQDNQNPKNNMDIENDSIQVYTEGLPSNLLLNPLGGNTVIHNSILLPSEKTKEINLGSTEMPLDNLYSTALHGTLATIDSVSTDNIKDNTITTEKIQNNTITAEKLDDVLKTVYVGSTAPTGELETQVGIWIKI